MVNDVCRYQPSRALARDRLAKVEQELRLTDNLHATVSRWLISLKFQVHAPTCCAARDVGTTMPKMLATTVGKDLDDQCNLLRTSGETAVSSH